MQLLPTMLRRTGDMASRSRMAMVHTITEIANADNIKVCGSWFSVFSLLPCCDILQLKLRNNNTDHQLMDEVTSNSKSYCTPSHLVLSQQSQKW